VRFDVFNIILQNTGNELSSSTVAFPRITTSAGLREVFDVLGCYVVFVDNCSPVFWDSQPHLQWSSSPFFLDCWSPEGGTDSLSQNVDKQQTINAKTLTTPWQKPEISQDLATWEMARCGIHTAL
jgi:hypothetical protein